MNIRRVWNPHFVLLVKGLSLCFWVKSGTHEKICSSRPCNNISIAKDGMLFVSREAVLEGTITYPTNGNSETHLLNFGCDRLVSWNTYLSLNLFQLWMYLRFSWFFAEKNSLNKTGRSLAMYILSGPGTHRGNKSPKKWGLLGGWPFQLNCCFLNMTSLFWTNIKRGGGNRKPPIWAADSGDIFRKYHHGNRRVTPRPGPAIIRKEGLMKGWFTTMCRLIKAYWFHISWSGGVKLGILGYP